MTRDPPVTKVVMEILGGSVTTRVTDVMGSVGEPPWVTVDGSPKDPVAAVDIVFESSAAAVNVDASGEDSSVTADG